MKTVLVTGANGFVGSYLVEAIRDRYTVIGLALSDKNETLFDGVNYLYGDIRDRDWVEKVLDRHKPDYIVHLAAKTSGWFNDPYETFETNLYGTINLYEGVHKVRGATSYNPKIIYVSTSEIYGKTANPESIDENALIAPTNHYAASKAAADRMSFAYTQSHKLNITIARPFTHTGPRQNKGFFVPDMASQIVDIETAEKGEVRVGNLESIRDYLDVRDVVKAYELLIEASTVAGEVYNICSGKPVRIQSILNSLLDKAKIPLAVRRDPKRMRPSDVPVFVGDFGKIHRLTGWSPVIDLEDTLRETLEYWRMIPDLDREATTGRL